MKKAGQLSIFVIIAILIVVALSITLYLFSSKSVSESDCETDSQCVPAECCHANTCTAIKNAPQCSDVFCTEICAPNTLDCAQGACRCVNNKCEAVLN